MAWSETCSSEYMVSSVILWSSCNSGLSSAMISRRQVGERRVERKILLERGGGEIEGKASRTYRPQLLITLPQLCLVPRTRPPALEHLLPVLYPPLCSSLAEVDLLGLVAPGECVEEDPVRHRQPQPLSSQSRPVHMDYMSPAHRIAVFCSLDHVRRMGGGRGVWVTVTHCFSSALACSSGPPLASGTLVSAPQSSMRCPSRKHCLSVAHPSV